MKANAKKPASLASIGRVLGAILVLVIMIFLTLSQANFLMGRSLLIAFGDSESTYKNAWLEWDGDVTAKEFVLYPYDIMDEEAAIRFEKVHLETPGWWWFLRNTFDRKLRTAKLERIHLTLTGGRVDTGFDPSLGDLGPFGASASPFEAEGCMSDSLWAYTELEEMGLHPEPTSLEFDYRVEGDQLLTTIVMETKGASRVKFERRSRLPGARVNALVLDTVANTTEFERWEVQDQGFVAARNKFCGKKDGIDARRYLERHVQAVERLLATAGLGVDEATRTAYRRFARDGGTFAFGGEFTQPIQIEDLYDLRDSGEAFTHMNARIEAGGSTTPVVFREFDPRPLDGLEDGETTFAAMEKERLKAAPPEPAVSDTTGTAPTTPSSTSTTTPAAAPADPSASADPAATARTPPRRRRSTDVEELEPPPSPETATPDTGLARIETPPPDPGRRLQWADLQKLQGHRVRIWTWHNPPRAVEILAVSGDSIRVTTSVGGGSGEYTIQRDAFLKAVLLD